MTSVAKVAGILTALVILGYALFLSLFPTYRVRYRLTLDVEDNGKPVSFSQIIEIRYELVPDFLVSGYGGRKFIGNFFGAAPTLDLGEKGLVFVIDKYSTDRWSSHCARNIDNKPVPTCVRSASLADLPFLAFGYPTDVMPSKAAFYLSQIQQRHDSAIIPIADLPMLIRFENISNPQSLEEVDPRDFAKKFGSGYALLRASLTLTSAPIGGPSVKWPPFLMALSRELKNSSVQEKLARGESLDKVSGTVARIHGFEQIYVTDFLNN